jgi:hypothetical protein
MGTIRWIIGAPIGLIVLCQMASAEPGRAATDAGHSAYRNISTSNDQAARFELDKPTVLAQTSVPAASAPAPAQESKAPSQDTKAPTDQSPPVASPSPAVSASEVARPARTVPGCTLRFVAAELAGKLNGRKWKEFQQSECAAGNTLVVFPAVIAPKYSGEQPDKARMHTCADQFTTNKASNGNGGLKWIEKSGGYYSECVTRLKG